MSKPNESDHLKRRGARVAVMTGIALVGVTALLLQLPLGATAGIATHKNDRDFSEIPPAPAAPNQKVPGTYQLRCWQYGRLLFEEGPVSLSAEARQGAKLVAINRQGAALIVTDMGGTTCLARPYAAVPNLGLPR
jgi:hypothetical protein